jgi:hypothetical protein
MSVIDGAAKISSMYTGQLGCERMPGLETGFFQDFQLGGVTYDCMGVQAKLGPIGDLWFGECYKSIYSSCWGGEVNPIMGGWKNPSLEIRFKQWVEPEYERAGPSPGRVGTGPAEIVGPFTALRVNVVPTAKLTQASRPIEPWRQCSF